VTRSVWEGQTLSGCSDYLVGLATRALDLAPQIIIDSVRGVSMRKALFFVAALVLAGCSSSPSTDEVAGALSQRFADKASVSDVRRMNGVDFPAGQGMPHRYAIEFQATLTPTRPVTFLFSGGLQAAVDSGALIQDVVDGHQPDPNALMALMSAGTARWRAEQSEMIVVHGSTEFLKTERGWQVSGQRVYLPESVVAEARARKELPAGWVVTRKPGSQGLAGAQFALSKARLLNADGSAQPYSVQYVPEGFMRHVADQLKARASVTLFSDPSETSSRTQISLPAGSLVSVLEAYTDVQVPRTFRPTTSLRFGGYELAAQTSVLPVFGTHGECPTFFLAPASFRQLCWHENFDSFQPSAESDVARTSFLVRTADGRKVWTKAYAESTEGIAAAVRADWLLCYAYGGQCFEG